MPLGDRTGPGGLGSMTGRGMGYCAGFPNPGFMNPGYGFGRGGWFGRGFGRGRGWGRGGFLPFLGYPYPWMMPYGYPFPYSPSYPYGVGYPPQYPEGETTPASGQKK